MNQMKKESNENWLKKFEKSERKKKTDKKRPTGTENNSLSGGDVAESVYCCHLFSSVDGMQCLNCLLWAYEGLEDEDHVTVFSCE